MGPAEAIAILQNPGSTEESQIVVLGRVAALIECRAMARGEIEPVLLAMETKSPDLIRAQLKVFDSMLRVCIEDDDLEDDDDYDVEVVYAPE